MEMPKTSSVQIISPMSGETRKLPPSSSPPASVAMMSRSVIGLEEERDQARDEPVEEACLGEGEAEPLDTGDLVAHLRLAGHRLDDLAEDDADADAGADGTEAAADSESDGLAGAGAVLSGGEEAEHGEKQVPRVLLSRIVMLGDGAAEVDRGQGGEDERLKRRDQADLEQEEGDTDRQRDEAEHLEAQQHGEAARHEEDDQVAGEDVGEETD